MRATHKIAAVVAAFASVAVPTALTETAPVVQASPGNGPTAIVSLGDSFISGEAGRWNGNSDSSWKTRNGTDRAYRRSGWFGWYYDKEAVYPGTVQNACHRSDVAPIRSNTIPVQNKINLACSGAETSAIISQAYKGEAPQSQQLVPVAQANDIEMIVLSIGGNDLGFSDIIVSCTLQFSTSPTSNPNYCNDDQQQVVDQKMPVAMAGVNASIASIRSSMNSAGYSNADYRLVVVSYPSPIPRGSEIRYEQSGYSRLTTGGCPFWNADATWARDSLVPQISDNLRSVASANGAEFLDYRDAFQGNENCSNEAQRAGSNGPNAATAEWTRWVGSGALQGDLEESVHPNAYGQQAMGRCLSLLWSQAPGGQFRCTNTANQGPNAMVLSPW